MRLEDKTSGEHFGFALLRKIRSRDQKSAVILRGFQKGRQNDLQSNALDYVVLKASD